MNLDFAQEKPIFQQIAEQIEDAIITGAFPEESQVPSTTELSVRFRINPATVLKGMNILVEQGVLYKKRGVGMFVADGAQKKIRSQRMAAFYERYVKKMLEEADKLGLSKQDIIFMIEDGGCA